MQNGFDLLYFSWKITSLTIYYGKRTCQLIWGKGATVQYVCLLDHLGIWLELHGCWWSNWILLRKKG